MIPELPSMTGPRGIDAYCHVCWEPVYRFWVAPELPDYDSCPIGPYTAQNCPNAVAGAHRAKLNRLVEDRALELWREREMTLPAFTRRMKPDDIDFASGAWAAIRKQAFLEVLTGAARNASPQGASAASTGPNPESSRPTGGERQEECPTCDSAGRCTFACEFPADQKETGR